MDLLRIKQLAGLAPLMEGQTNEYTAKIGNQYNNDVRSLKVKAFTLEEATKIVKGLIKESERVVGIQCLTESRYGDDDDDGLSRAERELANKADRDLKKSGVKVEADPDKDLEHISKKSKVAAKPNAEKAAPIAKKEEKPAGEGDAPKRGAGRAQAREWLTKNANAGRKDFMAYAKSVGMSGANASNMWHGRKHKNLAEFYIIRHPSYGKFVLAENKMYNRYQWIDETDNGLDAMVFETEQQAEKVVDHLENYKAMTGVIDKITQ